MRTDANGNGDRSSVRLSIQLLGTVGVILDGRRITAFHSVRLQRFLALVALSNNARQRSQLAFELWPDSEESQARTNLRKLIHEFRQALPDSSSYVDIGNSTIRWKSTGQSEVDVLRFREAIASGDLERAAHLYSGDFLPANYDDWVLDERERLRAEALAALLHLSEAAAESGDHESAFKHAERVVELEPTDEIAVRIQIEALIALGNKTAALRTYHRYAEVLRRELAAEPGESIANLYKQLRGFNRAQDMSHVHPPATVSESPFVGREEEWRLFENAWRSACAGSAHLLLITGEAGIGKSRLAHEYGRYVEAKGYTIASTRAYEAAGRLPWGPVVELLRSDAIGSQIATLGVAWRSDLANLLPELLDQAPSSPTTEFGNDVQRHRLFDAASRAIVSEDRPRLVIIDDLQWCDAETIELIGYVVRSGQNAPVLVVGTYRPEEIPKDHPLVALTDALAHDQSVTQVQLERFDKATTAELAAQLRSEETIDPEIATRLWTETEGNPLFIVEALRAGASAGARNIALTPTTRAILRARLSQLTDAAQRLAGVAAVIGRPFPVSQLASVTGIEEVDLIDDIDELWRRRIIRDHGHSYDFSHDKLREVALELISPARRRQLHRAVAEHLARDNANDIASISAQLAAHYDQAGMTDQAIDAYRIAGTRATGVSALEEAVSMFQRALAMLADLQSTPERDALELDLRIALGSPLVAIKGYGSRESHQLYERSLTLCRKLKRRIDPPILRGLGLARLQGCRFDESSNLGQALLDHDDRDPVTRTEGRYLSGVSAFWQGEVAAARRYLGESISNYDESHRGTHLRLYAQDPKAICLVRLALAELWAGDPGQADATARSAFTYASEINHVMTTAYVITYEMILAAECENFARLSELFSEADSLWKRLSERYLAVVGNALRAWREVCQGSLNSIDDIVRCVAQCRNEGETLHLTYTLLLLARARERSGEFSEGRAAAQEALEWSGQHGQHYLEAELWRIDGELAYRCGEAESAAVSLRNAVDTATQQGANWLALRALYSLAMRFPDQTALSHLRHVVETLPSGHDLPAFRTANDFLRNSG